MAMTQLTTQDLTHIVATHGLPAWQADHPGSAGRRPLL